MLGTVPAKLDGKRIPATGTADRTTVLLRSGADGQWKVIADLSAAGGDAGMFEPVGQLGDVSLTSSGTAALLGTTKKPSADDASAEEVPALVLRAADGTLSTAPTLERVPREDPDNPPPDEGTEPTPEPTPEGEEPTVEPAPEDAATPEPTPEETPAVEPAAETTPAQAATRPTTAGADSSATATTGPTSTDAPTPSPATTPEPTPTPAPTTESAAATTPHASSAPTTPQRATPGAAAAARAAGDVVLAADEHLYSGSRRIVMAVDEPGGRAGALVGVLRDGVLEDSVLHYDGAHVEP